MRAGRVGALTLTFLPQLRKRFDTPLVYLSPAGVWSADEGACLTYTIQVDDFMSSTWDWIGLYKVLGGTISSTHPSITSVRFEPLGFVSQVGFKSASDYETFVWVREAELPEVNEVIEVRFRRGGREVIGCGL